MRTNNESWNTALDTCTSTTDAENAPFTSNFFTIENYEILKRETLKKNRVYICQDDSVYFVTAYHRHADDK